MPSTLEMPSSDGHKDERGQNQTFDDKNQEELKDSEKVLIGQKSASLERPLLDPITRTNRELAQGCMFANSFVRYSWEATYFDDIPSPASSEEIEYLEKLTKISEDVALRLTKDLAKMALRSRENDSRECTSELPSDKPSTSNSEEQTQHDRNQEPNPNNPKTNKKTGKSRKKHPRK